MKVLTNPRKVALRRLHELEERHRIDARGRDVAPDPVDRQQAEGEQDPLAQVRDGEDVAETLLNHACSSSQVPPAASILARADLLNLFAVTRSALPISPSPSTLTGGRSGPDRARPASRA